MRPDLARISLTAKIMISMGTLILVLVTLLMVINMRSFSALARENEELEADRLCDAIKYGASHAMMINAREGLQDTVSKAARMADVESIRIVNKDGEIMFSSDRGEVGRTMRIDGFECSICHARTPIPDTLPLHERVRVLEREDGDTPRRLHIVSPILNDPGCSTETCHAHPPDKNVLGLLTLSMSLRKEEESVVGQFVGNSVYIVFAMGGIFAMLALVIYKLIHQPIRLMTAATRRIAEGDMACDLAVAQNDELGELAEAITTMCQEITAKHVQITKQRELYQNLFEGVPCIITVQDREFKLLGYNRIFSDSFQVEKGAHCYEAYKGRTEKCPRCPVEETFATGRPAMTEEAGVYKDGSPAHWLVTTAPIRDETGTVVAAMEMCLDITSRKQLEEELRKSERKYHEIFNSIPNPVFVLDAGTLEIIDCNKNVTALYGFRKGELIGLGVSMLFPEDAVPQRATALREGRNLARVANLTRDGSIRHVNMNVASSEFHGRAILLVTVMDQTERIRAEQQLIQAAKMATLGEMATGVAHELNQPLAVIQMAANFLLRRIDDPRGLDEEAVRSMAVKLKANVERSTKIISHMREFGRKPSLETQEVDLNLVLRKACDFFSQQLRQRDIAVDFDLEEGLPPVKAEPNRLEQVFVNLLINARDAIEQKCRGDDCGPTDRVIRLHTKARRHNVLAEVADTGVGIPAAVQERLFEPFFSTKEVGKGTGLGLSISYGIVHDYGGSITVHSKPGQGARFIVSFPRAGAD
jgi:histidine kinase